MSPVGLVLRGAGWSGFKRAHFLLSRLECFRGACVSFDLPFPSRLLCVNLFVVVARGLLRTRFVPHGGGSSRVQSPSIWEEELDALALPSWSPRRHYCFSEKSALFRPTSALWPRKVPRLSCVVCAAEAGGMGRTRRRAASGGERSCAAWPPARGPEAPVCLCSRSHQWLWGRTERAGAGWRPGEESRTPTTLRLGVQHLFQQQPALRLEVGTALLACRPAPTCPVPAALPTGGTCVLLFRGPFLGSLYLPRRA